MSKSTNMSTTIIDDNYIIQLVQLRAIILEQLRITSATNIEGRVELLKYINEEIAKNQNQNQM